MKIIALPDLHHATNSLKSLGIVLTTLDLVLLVGDITEEGNPDDAREVVRFLQQQNCPILAVPGNWDGPDVLQFLEEEHINIHRQSVMLDDTQFIGIGSSLPTGLNSPNEITEEIFKSTLNDMRFLVDPSRAYILVSHQPPSQTINDKIGNGLHIGSNAVRRFIEETQPLVCFTGHIHEGLGIDRIGGTTHIINPGPLRQGKYAYVEIEKNQVTIIEIRSMSR